KYSKDQSFVPPTQPFCVVQPKNVEEIQRILKIANHYKIPVVPYSTGENNQGAAIPTYPGIIIDLGKMNRIIFIDDLQRNAMIQPGVTFSQLQDEAKKHGLRVLTPLELPASASVLVTYLEMVPLYAWPKHGTETLLTMRLVLPTGEIMGTGQAALLHEEKPYDPMYGVNCFLNRIFFAAQGTFGIVYEGVVKLKNLCEANEVVFISLEKVEDGFKIIKELKFWNLGEEVFMMNNMDLALMLADNPSKDLPELRNILPKWTLIVVFRGTSEYVEVQEADLKDLASNLGFKFQKDLSGVKKADEKVLAEIDYPKGWRKWSEYKGARNTIPFITLIKSVPSYNNEVYKLAESHNYPKEDIGCTLLPAEVFRVHYQFSFHRNPNDSEETERVKSLYMQTVQKLFGMGAYFSRPYPLWAEIAYSRAKTYHMYLKKLKQIVDPNNIMNPGKLAF
ncbi:MAG: hypothetical protein DRO36_05505, partial [Candidatus Hecatellales archaeon]